MAKYQLAVIEYPPNHWGISWVKGGRQGRALGTLFLSAKMIQDMFLILEEWSQQPNDPPTGFSWVKMALRDLRVELTARSLWLQTYKGIVTPGEILLWTKKNTAEQVLQRLQPPTPSTTPDWRQQALREGWTPPEGWMGEEL